MSGALSEGQVVARLERLPQSWWHVKTRIIVGTATFFDAFDALTIAVTLPSLVTLWKLTPPQIGFLISVGYVGQIVGAIFFGWFAERYGRIKALVGCVLILSVMSLACAFAWSHESLLWFRTVQGFGLGGEVPIAAAYISEIAKADQRGRFVLLYELIFPVGLVAGSMLAVWVVPAFGWQAMFVIGALPAILIFFLIQMVPELPRWLASRGRLAEADAIVTELERIVTNGRPETLPAPSAAVGKLREAKAPFVSLFQGRYLKRTLVVWSLWLLASLVSYTLTTWLPTIYRTVFNMPVQDALKFGVLNNVFGLVGGLFAALLMDVWGRRNWFIFAFFGAAAPLIYLGLNAQLSATMVLWSSSICSFFIYSLLLSLYLYTPEVYPTRSRALGVSVATSWQRVGSIIGPMFVSYSIGSFGLAAVFAAFAGVSLVGAVVAMIWMEETKQLSLEQLSP